MISISKLRDNIYPIVKLLDSPGAYIDVVYNNRLYRLHMQDLKQDAMITKKRKPLQVDLGVEIRSNKCPLCKKLMLNDVCMSPTCSSNLDLG